jgi:S-adenosylmethionine-dependent methyltransferase
VAESDIVKPFYPGGLTPQTPLASQWVCDQLHALGLQVSWLRGVRCFADYLQANVRSRMTEEQLLAIERTYRTEMPYRQMARYIHLLAVKPPTDVSSEQ